MFVSHEKPTEKSVLDYDFRSARKHVLWMDALTGVAWWTFARVSRD